MAIRERRTTHYEWTCDGPSCGLVERVFGRGERPVGWLTMKVTDRTTKAFHDKLCADTYFEQSLDDGLPKVEEPDVDPEADMYGANA